MTKANMKETSTIHCLKRPNAMPSSINIHWLNHPLPVGAAKWPEPQHDARRPAPLPPLLPGVDGQLGRFNDHWLVAKELRPPSNTNQQNGFVLLIYVNIISIEIISVHSVLSSLHLQTFEGFTCKSWIYSLVVNQCIFQLNVKVVLLLIFWHREWNEKKI